MHIVCAEREFQIFASICPWNAFSLPILCNIGQNVFMLTGKHLFCWFFLMFA